MQTITAEHFLEPFTTIKSNTKAPAILITFHTKRTKSIPVRFVPSGRKLQQLSVRKTPISLRIPKLSANFNSKWYAATTASMTRLYYTAYLLYRIPSPKQY